MSELLSALREATPLVRWKLAMSIRKVLKLPLNPVDPYRAAFFPSSARIVAVDTLAGALTLVPLIACPFPLMVFVHLEVFVLYQRIV